jgi:teichuronic acid exporter
MFKHVVWDFLGKVANQVIAFAVSIILARILQPSEFGIVGIALALVGFSAIFYDFGLKASVIQAETISQRQLSTIFFLNLLGGLFLFLLFFGLSSLIESFYDIENLAEVITAVGALLLLNATASLPLGLLSRKLAFKKIASINFAAAFVAGLVAVTMAYNGWGIWSLIANTLINALIVLAGAFLVAGWKPQPVFALKEIKPLWRFGSTVFGIEVLESIFSRIDVFLIGKIFQATTLGYYTRAQSLDNMVKQFSSGSLIAVVLPYFSRIKNDRQQLNSYYLQSLHIIAFASLFLTGFLFVVSTDLFTLLFTNKWTFAGEVFQIIALAGFAYPVGALMVNVILAMGKTKAIVRLELIKKLTLIPFLFIGFLSDIKLFCYMLVAGYWMTVLLNAFFVSRVIEISLKDQLIVIGRYLVITIVSSLLTYLLTYTLNGHPMLMIAVRGSVFLIIYCVSSYFSRTAGSQLVLNKLLEALRGKRMVKTI